MPLTDKPLDIPCPGCKTKIRTSLTALERSNKLRCPSCSAEVTINGAKAPTDAFRGLEKTLKNIGAKRVEKDDEEDDE